MAQVYGAGGKTIPKPGKNGTGSYWPAGTPKYLHRGNVFPGINVLQPDFPQQVFGEGSRAGQATQTNQPRTLTRGTHPNKAHYNTITLPLVPATIPASPADNTNMVPITPADNFLLMPHERNTNSASGTKKKPNTYRTAFGASMTMASDTAFDHNPGVNYKHSKRNPPQPAVEAVKKGATQRTFGRDSNPLPKGGGSQGHQQHRTPPPSFVSHGNNWYDPHNSFIAGHMTTAGKGVGRWSMVKKGVV